MSKIAIKNSLVVPILMSPYPTVVILEVNKIKCRYSLHYKIEASSVPVSHMLVPVLGFVKPCVVGCDICNSEKMPKTGYNVAD